MAWRWDGPGLAFSGKGIVVPATVGAVGGLGLAAGRDGLLVSSLGTGWVLAVVSGPSIMKRAIGTRGVFLFAALGGMAEMVAVGTMGVAACLDNFLNFESL